MSDELIDLILKMLEKDPNERIDVHSIYQHSWMQKYKAKLECWTDSEEEAADGKDKEPKVKAKRPASESTSFSSMEDELVIENDED